jgi:aspartate/methionine/tyrosine aminotransferase
MQRAVLEEAARELESHGGTLIVDEVFRVPSETVSAMTLEPQVVTIGSLSKTYGLPGLRLGWIAANRERLARLRTVQQYLTLSLSAMTVALGAAVLKKAAQFSRAELLRVNRPILRRWADGHQDAISMSQPAGGTTVCLAINTVVDEMTLFDKFLKNGVLVAPGTHCFEFTHETPWFRLGYGI